MAVLNKRSKNFTAVSGATAGTYKYVVMDNIRYLAAQITISGTSVVSVEATSDATAYGTDTALAALTWTDITNAYFGVSNISSSGNFVIDSPFPWHALRFKVVSSSGATTNIYYTAMK